MDSSELKEALIDHIKFCKETLTLFKTGEWKVIDKDGTEHPEKHLASITMYEEMLLNSEEMLKDLG